MSQADVELRQAFGLAPRAAAAWLDLQRAVGSRTPPPCAADPATWTADDADLVRAGLGCLACSAAAACRRYADLADERSGVWGGALRHPDGRVETLELGPPPRRLGVERIVTDRQLETAADREWAAAWSEPEAVASA